MNISKRESYDMSKPRKGIFEKDGILYVCGTEYVNRVASALSNETRVEILKSLYGKEADIGDIARQVRQSKANAIAQIKKLESAGLIKTIYKPGHRGVKKVCTTTVKEVRLFLNCDD